MSGSRAPAADREWIDLLFFAPAILALGVEIALTFSWGVRLIPTAAIDLDFQYTLLNAALALAALTLALRRIAARRRRREAEGLPVRGRPGISVLLAAAIILGTPLTIPWSRRTGWDAGYAMVSTRDLYQECDRFLDARCSDAVGWGRVHRWTWLDGEEVPEGLHPRGRRPVKVAFSCRKRIVFIALDCDPHSSRGASGLLVSCSHWTRCDLVRVHPRVRVYRFSVGRHESIESGWLRPE